jgi:hypothetical protein
MGLIPLDCWHSLGRTEGLDVILKDGLFVLGNPAHGKVQEDFTVVYAFVPCTFLAAV